MKTGKKIRTSSWNASQSQEVKQKCVTCHPFGMKISSVSNQSLSSNVCGRTRNFQLAFFLLFRAFPLNSVVSSLNMLTGYIIFKRWLRSLGSSLLLLWTISSLFLPLTLASVSAYLDAFQPHLAAPSVSLGSAQLLLFSILSINSGEKLEFPLYFTMAVFSNNNWNTPFSLIHRFYFPHEIFSWTTRF